MIHSLSNHLNLVPWKTSVSRQTDKNIQPANQNRACQIEKVHGIFCVQCIRMLIHRYTRWCITWSLSVPASSRLCCMANWSKLSSSSLIGSLRPGPSVVYSGGGSNTDGSISHCRGGGGWPESSEVRLNTRHSHSHITLQPKTGCPLKLSRAELVSTWMGDLLGKLSCCWKRC